MDSGLPIFLGFFLPGLIIVSANAVIFFFIAREIHDTLKSAPKADKQEKWKVHSPFFNSSASPFLFLFSNVVHPARDSRYHKAVSLFLDFVWGKI